MTVLDTFTILFSTDAPRLREELKKTEKAYDDLAKKVDRTGDEKKKMAELSKSIKEMRGELEKYDDAKSDTASSLLKLATGGLTAYAAWEGIKAAIGNAIEFNSQLERQHLLTGQSTESLAAWDAAFTKSTGKKGEFIDWFTQYTDFLRESGQSQGIKNVLPNLLELSETLRNMPIDQARNRWAQLQLQLHLPDDFFIQLRDGKSSLLDLVREMEKLNHVTAEGTEASLEFSGEWQKSIRIIEGGFTNLWNTIAPIFTGILSFFNRLAETPAFVSVLKIANTLGLITLPAGLRAGLDNQGPVSSKSVSSAPIDTSNGIALNAPNPFRGIPAFKGLEGNANISAAQLAISASDLSPYNTSNNTTQSSSSKTLNIGSMNVQTQAKDPQEVSEAIKHALDNHFNTTINNLDDNISR